MLELSDRKPLEETEPAHQQLLADLQSNILSSHQHSSTQYFLLSFERMDSSAVKRVLRDLALGSDGLPAGLGLDSELRSRARRALGRKNRADASEIAWAEREVGAGSSFSSNLLLGARCYREFLEGLTVPSDLAFSAGLPGRDDSRDMFNKLHDPDFSRRGPRPHALYSVAHDLGQAAWQAAHARIQEYLRAHGVTVREEAGYLLRHRHGQGNFPIEPFGYRDGITQPFFYGSEVRARGRAGALRPHEGRGASPAPLSLVLVPDPNGATEHSCGTYAVYRKLKQDVAAFYRQAESLAAVIPAPPSQVRLTTEQVADRLIGRRPDGTPLDTPPGAPPTSTLSSFPSNSVFPVHAHARKVNPRTYDGVPRIVRRSTVYGPRLKRTEEGRPLLHEGEPVTDDGQVVEGDGVGLMFLCYQANIADQFEAIQARYANNLQGGADTVISQLPRPVLGRLAPTNRVGFNGSGLVYPYRQVVELLEGEYFFAPSIGFFSALKP